MTEFRLNPQQVEEVFEECLNTDPNDPGGITDEIDGIVFIVRFNRYDLERHAELIGQMLMELPEKFRKTGGGGASFLQACDDRHGNQWTGLHQTMSQLFCMGQALGLVECQLPRYMWSVLPGGMPYYVIRDDKIAAAV